MDILERIAAYDCSDGGHSDAAQGSAYDLLDDAKAEIERLQAAHAQAFRIGISAQEENEKLRTALKPFAEHSHCVDHISQSNLALWCAQALLAVALNHEQKGNDNG